MSENEYHHEADQTLNFLQEQLEVRDRVSSHACAAAIVHPTAAGAGRATESRTWSRQLSEVTHRVCQPSRCVSASALVRVCCDMLWFAAAGVC
jgi:hypothetical protein